MSDLTDAPDELVRDERARVASDTVTERTQLVTGAAASVFMRRTLRAKG